MSIGTTRQTELEAELPLHVVFSWVGLSEAVVKEASAKKADSLIQKTTLQAQAATRAEPQEMSENTGRNEKSQVSLASFSGGGGN